MKKDPKVSIIIPIFNPSNLSECLDSILNQSEKNIEIICVNDGSKDYVNKILNSIKTKDSRVIVINQKNKGTSAARNNGILHAKGEYITFVDHDDWVEDFLYEMAYNLAKKYDADIVQWGFQMNMPGSSDIKYFGSNNSKFYLGDKAKNKFLERDPCWPPVWRRLYKTSIIKNNDLLFDETLKCGGEDANFNISLLPYINRVYDIGKPLYHWCRKENGILLSRRTTKDLLNDLCLRAVKYGKVLTDLRCYGYNIKQGKNYYKKWANYRLQSLKKNNIDYIIKQKIFLLNKLSADADNKIEKSFQEEDVLNSIPIDAIYTYADVSDSSLPLLYNYSKDVENEELRYSIRSILKNIPWIRKIFIFMPNKNVRYLKDKFIDDKIIYVTDKEILNLDRASIIAKEFNLWKLKDLGCSENVIYFNDDYFIGRRLRKSDFFYKDKDKIVPYVFYKDLIVKRNYLELIDQRRKYLQIKREEFEHTPELYYTQLLNGYLFLSKILKTNTLRVPVDIRKTMHNAQGFNLTELEKIYNLVKNNYEYAADCLEGLYRNEKQITAPVLYDFYFLNKENRKLSTIDYVFIDIANIAKYKLNYSLFCVNTGNRFYSNEQKIISRKILNKTFPKKSVYEY